MIGILGGNAETVDAVKSSLGKTINVAGLENDALKIGFTDGSMLSLWDDGQSCCEHRYMVCDDSLASFCGAKVVDIQIKDAPEIADPYGESHEVQFLEVLTDRGAFQCASHNEHNGYYGGFYIKASLTNPLGQA